MPLKLNTVEPRKYGHQWAKKICVNNEVTVLTRVSLQENVCRFCRAAKKSGRNNEDTILPRWPEGGVPLYLLVAEEVVGESVIVVGRAEDSDVSETVVELAAIT